jgi:hypothetical protein
MKSATGKAGCWRAARRFANGGKLPPSFEANARQFAHRLHVPQWQIAATALSYSGPPLANNHAGLLGSKEVADPAGDRAGTDANVQQVSVK